MLTLDRNAPMSVTYGPDTSVFPFYQDGLYFDRQGALVDMQHNRDAVASRGLSWDSAIGREPQAAPMEPPAPSAVAVMVEAQPAADDGLAGKNAAQMFAIAQKLRAQLDVEADADQYVPTLENVDGNHEFIARHLKGE